MFGTPATPSQQSTGSSATSTTGEPYNPEQPSIESDEVLTTEKETPDESAAKEESDNKTQDELVSNCHG